MRATLGAALLALVALLAGPFPSSMESAAEPAVITFVDDAAASRNTTSPWVVLPATVAAGDRLVLFLSLSASDRQVSPPTGVTGWTLEGDRTARTMRTLVWSKVADPGDSGAQVTIPLSSSAKGTVQVAAYRGVAAGDLTVVSQAWTTTSTVRPTPLAPVAEGDWAASYWASKSASTTAWATPPEVVARKGAVNTGSGRIASQLADSAAAVPAGTYGGIAATSNASSQAATTWTVVLPASPPVPNEPPVAAFTHTCAGLGCAFDASTSWDPEQALASYDWDFGDGENGSGVTPGHTYDAGGTYDVTLTVTDVGGATDQVTVPVEVTDPDAPREVTPDGETTPVLRSGDAADDPAIWVHPTVPEQSLVIGNDKQGALEVYGLDGTRRQRITTGTSFWGNVDVRQQVTVGAQTRDLVLAYNAGIRPYAVDPDTGLLTPVGDGNGAIPTGGGEGLCAYRSATTGELSVFVITRPGRLRQYVIHDGDGDGLLQGTLVREFVVGSESEGCLADDTSGALYVSEEDVGLWRYGAEPGAGSARVLVDSVGPGGHLAFDVEGVTLAETGPDTGLLMVSAQNGADPDASYFAVYDRQTNGYLWSFRISDGPAADGCERTDGIAVTTAALGPGFPAGLFVCQDNGNTSPAPGNQNFKLTRLDRILPGE